MKDSIVSRYSKDSISYFNQSTSILNIHTLRKITDKGAEEKGAKEEGEKKDEEKEEKETKEEFMNAQMGATVAANAAANHNVAGIGGYE
ncbi:MAG: hypothetical protein ACO3PR_17225, partial [Limisphaerales bacterium]